MAEEQRGEAECTEADASVETAPQPAVDCGWIPWTGRPVGAVAEVRIRRVGYVHTDMSSPTVL